jgi:hypothetical protein
MDKYSEVDDIKMMEISHCQTIEYTNEDFVE